MTHNGGTGARPGKDRLSVTAFPSGVYGSQVEVTESTSPLLVRRCELHPDSGGAGKYRGGLGQVIEIENREHVPFDFFGTVDRVKYPVRRWYFKPPVEPVTAIRANDLQPWWQRTMPLD